MKTKVPAPWTPVRLTMEGNRVTAAVWGREYVWENSLLPVSIRTAGEELLSGPACLRASFDGEEKPFENISFLPISADEDRAVFTVCGQAGNILCNIRWTVEYDGFLEMALSVIPYWSFWGVSPVALDGLSLRIPFRKERSSLYHYWPTEQYDGLASGAVPEGGLSCGFKPYVWCGWEFGGLGIAAETDENVALSEGSPCITIREEGGGRVLSWNLLERRPEAWEGREDTWSDALEPVDYVFGIQATPVKELRRDRGEFRIAHVSYTCDDQFLAPGEDGETLLDKFRKCGVTWMIFHESWSAMQNYGQAVEEERFLRCVEECHRRGMRVMAYFGYEYPTNGPEWFEKRNEYLLRNPRGHYTGGWQRHNPPQRAYMVCYAGGYAEGMRERVRYAMEHYHLDGIYTDGTHVPWACANEVHGCGYTDRNGVRHSTYPIFAARHHARALYELVHGMGGVIDTHQSSCLMAPTLAFADSFYNGESIQEKLKEGFLEFLNLPAFRTEYMGKNLGLFPQLLAYTDDRMSIRKAASLSLIHDVLPRPGTVADAEVVSPFWKALSDFDSGNALWHPYWQEDCPVKPLMENVCCSVYEKNGRYLCAVSSFNEGTDTVELRVPAPAQLVSMAPGMGKARIEGDRLILDIKAFEPELVGLTFRKTE